MSTWIKLQSLSMTLHTRFTGLSHNELPHQVMDSRALPERQPLLRSHSSVHGITAPQGASNLIQTIFNSTNVLLGVGLLSLPLGIKYAGWIAGSILLVASALVTAYTAKVLARCLDSDKSLATYADLAYASYGSTAMNTTRVLFSLVLTAACTALVILFGDIMNLLLPHLTVLQWKVMCGLILIPLQFIPFSLLSYASMIGVAASLGLVAMTVLAGILKDESPGSLRQPAATYLFPATWATLPLSIGLIMSPWGGHASFPNLYRDMRNPAKYNRALLFTFSTTFAVDVGMAACGYLMYGMDTRDEIIANILITPGHPRALLIIIVGLVAIMPVTKIPLSSRPLVIMIEGTIGLDPAIISTTSRFRDDSGNTNLLLLLARSGLRVFVALFFVVISVICPNFDVIIGLAGSALVLSICVILPLLFHVKLLRDRLTLTERVSNWVLIVTAAILAIIGTIWALIPTETLEKWSTSE